MRCVAALVTGLLLLAALPARAQERPETTERWREWTARFVGQLQKNPGREHEVVEELSVQGALSGNDVEPWAKASFAALRLGDSRKGFAKGGQYHILVAGLVRECLRRPGGADHPDVLFVVGRLRMSDSLASEDEERHVATRAAVATFAKCIAKCGKDHPLLEEVRAWHFRAVVSNADDLLARRLASDAVESLRKVMETNRENALLGKRDWLFAKLNLAESHRRLDERKVAEEILKKLTVEHSRAARPFYLLGKVYADQALVDEALQMFGDAKARAVVSDDRPVLMDILYETALAMLRTDPPQVDGAERAALEYLELSKDDPDGLFLLAQVAHERGDLDRAIKLLRRVKRMEPDDLVALKLLKQYLYDAGNAAEGAEVQALIEKLQPGGE